MQISYDWMNPISIHNRKTQAYQHTRKRQSQHPHCPVSRNLQQHKQGIFSHQSQTQKKEKITMGLQIGNIYNQNKKKILHPIM